MTAIKISQADQMREAVLHAHADMQVALKMRHRRQFITAWRKVQQGYDRLEKALAPVENNGNLSSPDPPPPWSSSRNSNNESKDKKQLSCELEPSTVP